MKKILIVDDSPDLLYAMQKLLAFYNFTIQVAKDSQGFMKIFPSYKPDIIIIDVMLNGEDGRDLCKKLRENPAYNHIAIILFSASPKSLENFKENGADGAIEKPFGINDFINQIKFAVLNRKELLTKSK